MQATFSLNSELIHASAELVDAIASSLGAQWNETLGVHHIYCEAQFNVTLHVPTVNGGVAALHLDNRVLVDRWAAYSPDFHCPLRLRGDISAAAGVHLGRTFAQSWCVRQYYDESKISFYGARHNKYE